MQYFSYLESDDIKYVHESSLEILEEVGLLVRNEKARKRFAEHGCHVDHETEMVRMPSAVVEKYRAMVPPSSTEVCALPVPDTR